MDAEACNQLSAEEDRRKLTAPPTGNSEVQLLHPLRRIDLGRLFGGRHGQVQELARRGDGVGAAG
jgi:hypothetical protein